MPNLEDLQEAVNKNDLWDIVEEKAQQMIKKDSNLTKSQAIENYLSTFPKVYTLYKNLPSGPRKTGNKGKDKILKALSGLSKDEIWDQILEGAKKIMAENDDIDNIPAAVEKFLSTDAGKAFYEGYRSAQY